jgi:aryl-alcohol dehydrogenase-like predicted oxidoreductase
VADNRVSNHRRIAIDGPFTLGTAQFGPPYGLGAAREGLDTACVHAILDRAAAEGVAWLDTARAYGDAEARIGAWGETHARRFRLVSKLPNLAGTPDEQIIDVARAAFEESKARLRTEHIDVYLTHKASDLQRPDIAALLRTLQADGQIGAFGASAYTVDDSAAALSVEDIGALQIPLNVTSSAFIESGLLERAEAQGVIVFARSVFLQGALLLSPDRLPPHLQPLGDVNQEMQYLAREAGLTLPELLMATVRALRGVSSLVLGVNSVAQLTELSVAIGKADISADLRASALEIGGMVAPEVADPRRWPKT